MASGINTWYNNLSPLGRQVVNFGAGIAAFELFKAVRDAAGSRTERKELQTTSRELAQSVKTKPLSYTKSQYEAWANSLEDYMFDAGTDKTGILDVMKKLKNDSDFLALKEAFGKRKYYTFGISYGFKTLGQWLAVEDSWLEYLVNDVNEVLKSKKIQYRF